ncbi:MAG: hypothetical protein ACYC1L_13085 [Alphaproteobacteria bacterium]
MRSPHAHARIRGIQTAKARRLPGVLAIVTAADWQEAGLGDFPLWARIPSIDRVERAQFSRPVLCRDEVCFVGDPVAMVVAESRARRSTSPRLSRSITSRCRRSRKPPARSISACPRPMPSWIRISASCRRWESARRWMPLSPARRMSPNWPW